jgi:hypothetical protein
VLLIDRQSILAFTPGVVFTSLGDTPSEVLGIPGNPTLVGSQFFLQAVFVDGPTITGLSNGVTLIICE